MGDMSYEHLYISAYMRRGPDEMRINCLVKDSPYLDFVHSCQLQCTTPRAYFTTIFEFYYAWNYANRKLRRAKFRSKICFSAQFRSKDNVTTGSFGCSAQDYGFSVSCYGGANIYRYSACVISQNRGWFWLFCFWLPLQITDRFTCSLKTVSLQNNRIGTK